MNASETGLVKVLLANYGDIDFLINRSQCSSSIFASGFTPIKSKHRYLSRLIEVDNDLCLLFDLDLYLTETFHLTPTGTAQLAVIVDLKFFSNPTVRFLRQHVLPQLGQWEPDKDRVAFLISSNTSVQELKINDFSPHPPVLQKHLMKKGLVTTGFCDTRIRFLIDLEKLIASKQIFRREEHSDSGEQV